MTDDSRGPTLVTVESARAAAEQAGIAYEDGLRVLIAAAELYPGDYRLDDELQPDIDRVMEAERAAGGEQ